MRLLIAVLVAVTSLLTVVSPAHAGPATHNGTTDWSFVEHELFEVPLQQFIADAHHGNRWFDWTNDGCSAPLLGDTGRSYNFRDACRRHDFGYRNLKRLEHRYGKGRTYWNATNRRRVDQQFLADMKHHCRSRSWWLQPSCFIAAYAYYATVRAVAGP